jgi:hypothetical protein
LSRRPDPERIFEARRAAITNRLVDEDRVPRELAEQWIRGWELEADDRGLQRQSASFWDDARAWILEQRRAPGGRNAGG